MKKSSLTGVHKIFQTKQLPTTISSPLNEGVMKSTMHPFRGIHEFQSNQTPFNYKLSRSSMDSTLKCRRNISTKGIFGSKHTPNRRSKIIQLPKPSLNSKAPFKKSKFSTITCSEGTLRSILGCKVIDQSKSQFENLTKRINKMCKKNDQTSKQAKLENSLRTKFSRNSKSRKKLMFKSLPIL